MRPSPRKTCATMRPTVDFPLVPVTAMTGMRARTPRGNIISMALKNGSADTIVLDLDAAPRSDRACAYVDR